MGTPDFALFSLKALCESGENVVAVVTQTDKPKGRGYTLTPPPVKLYAAERGIPVYQPKTLKDGAFADELAAIDPEMIVVVAFGKLLPKYVLDYPAEQEICVELPQTDKVVEPSLPGLSTNLYELQLLQARETLAKKQLSMTREGYLPTLSLSGSWMFSSYTDKLSHWFHSGPSNHWYRSNGLGLSLRVPIFDGFDKRSKIRKGKIDIETAQTQYANTLKNLQTQYVNATCDMENNRRNYKKQKDNCTLAENVCRVTTDRYKEGIASMTDVLQDEMRITEAQNNYITAHYNYQVANLTLLKLTGQLDKLM